MAPIGSKRGSDRASYHDGMRMAGVGFQFALEVAAGAGLGALVDWKFGTSPTGTLIGAGTGLAVGTWTLIKSSRDLLQRWNAEDARRAGVEADPGGSGGADAPTSIKTSSERSTADLDAPLRETDGHS